MLGRIDEVDGHYVATKFAAFIPLRSVYIASSTSPRATLGAGNELRIRTQWRSVLLGLGRIWAPVAAAILPIAELIVAHRVSAVSCLVSLGWLGLSALTYRRVAISDAEKARLRLLGTITGLRIDPAKLTATIRARKCASLAALMDKGGIPLTAAEIVSVIDEIPHPAMPLVYGYARYAGDDPEWQDCAEQIYARHQAGDL